MHKTEKGAYTVPELARELGLSETIIRRRLRAKEIPHMRIGRRYIMPRPAIEAWIKRNMVRLPTAA